MALMSHIDSTLRTSLLTSANTLLEERAQHLSRVAEIDVQLGAIETLTGQSLRPKDAAQVPEHQVAMPNATPQTWIQFIVAELSKVKGGLTRRQFSAAIKNSPDFAARYARSPNSYYNAMQRLEIAGRIVRKERATYLKETWEKIEKGIMQDETAPDEGKGGMPDYITRVLEAAPCSMTAAEVVAALRDIPEAKAKMEANKQIAYATLSRLVSLGMIQKDEKGRYRMREDQLPHAQSLELVQEGSRSM